MCALVTGVQTCALPICRRISRATYCHLGAVGMAVNPATGLSIDLSVQRMSRLEAKLFAEFEHHGIPMNLCVCKLSRQRGCSRQYEIGRASCRESVCQYV